jgi:phosphatidylserine/phosphatidylglycerophosphate/cardiolipin synthase-like enzyme
MWGGTGLTPNATNSKFGPDKTDNTPHTFTIDGKTVESYFSPSDGTNSHILSTINSANDDIFFGVYTFTDNNDALAIKAKFQAGIYCAGIMDQFSNTYTAYSTLSPVMGNKLKIYTQSSSIYHNKFVIVDACNQLSDPQVLTGSHNWTSSADTKNDENTVIVHDATIANIYYQSFYQNFYSLSGTLSACTVTDINENSLSDNLINIYPNPASDKITVKNNSDELQEVSIYSINGQLMIQKEINSPEMNIDISSLSQGIYVIRISGNSNSFVTKMIKE